MKKMVILFVMLLCCGCTAVRINTANISNITSVVLSKNNKLSNRVGKGYKYYVPKGVSYVDNVGFNEKLYSNGNYYYLFVDAISYYHNRDIVCNFDQDAYFKEEINSNGKHGCLQISEQGKYYLIRFFYNYARIETTVFKEDLNQSVLNASYILSTIKFNDTTIKLLLDDSYFNNREIVYDKYSSNSDVDRFYRLVEEQLNVKDGE